MCDRACKSRFSIYSHSRTHPQQHWHHRNRLMQHQLNVTVITLVDVCNGEYWQQYLDVMVNFASSSLCKAQYEHKCICTPNPFLLSFNTNSNTYRPCSARVSFGKRGCRGERRGSPRLVPRHGAGHVPGGRAAGERPDLGAGQVCCESVCGRSNGQRGL